MDRRKERRANLVAVLALLAGVAVFFFTLYGLAVVALYAGLLKIWIINPVPDPFPWVMPTIIGISILLGIIVVWWIHRLQRSGSMFGGK
jgi:sterol desaturase/sphingolipid hydroxylase (fatty acid hydroxylase superfamily)